MLLLLAASHVLLLLAIIQRWSKMGLYKRKNLETQLEFEFMKRELNEKRTKKIIENIISAVGVVMTSLGAIYLGKQLPDGIHINEYVFFGGILGTVYLSSKGNRLYQELCSKPSSAPSGYNPEME